MRGQGRAGSRTQGWSRVSECGRAIQRQPVALTGFTPNNPEEGLRGSSRAQSRTLRVAARRPWPSGWAALLRAGPQFPWPCFRGTQTAPHGLIHFLTDCLVGGPSVQPHAQEQARQTHHAALDLSRLPLPPGQNHLSSMERQQEP